MPRLADERMSDEWLDRIRRIVGVDPDAPVQHLLDEVAKHKLLAEASARLWVNRQTYCCESHPGAPLASCKRCFSGHPLIPELRWILERAEAVGGPEQAKMALTVSNCIKHLAALEIGEHP